MVGTIKWYNPRRKYGFIQGEGDSSYFIHESSIETARKYEGFESGDEVVFDIGNGRKKGKTQAEHVAPVEDGVVTEGRHVGTIKWFDFRKKYGFIEEGDKTHFVHLSCVDKAREYIGFDKGDKVEFEESTGNKGPMALHCKLVDDDE